jgi:hypothetical protein
MVADHMKISLAGQARCTASFTGLVLVWQAVAVLAPTRWCAGSLARSTLDPLLAEGGSSQREREPASTGQDGH